MKKIIFTTLITFSALSFSMSVLAGEGGVAGAASFQITSSAVTEASAAVAIGKSTAYAGALTDGNSGDTEAFAVGTGGIITFDTSDNIYIESVAQDTNLRIGQANGITDSTINIDADAGTLNETIN